ncbi:bifunctional 5,10-methylenetetrahydrofolate dehydrogenase/5,10-methenyltetrahydrofolate cyclohydrolase [Candidatus Gracilibacteria bacterium]|nr:bifunctional 5,10-methylenetetrahydrofolate dehydrogenase/5,10-methenyltetrahydrofolate cyclohydrolase [Candidatus Gracilibacteria bacterium]
MIINGGKIAKKMYEKLREDVSQIKGDKPTLGAILVGDNSASLRYIKQKRKWAKFVGMNFELKQFEENISEKKLLQFIESWNNDENISGYIIQLPLPEHINSTKILRTVSPEKDVDGFHPENQGKVLLGDESGFAPCTPHGVMEIFEELGSLLTSPQGRGIKGLQGKEVVVIGKSNIVGKPLVAMLMNAGATVITCNSKTPDINKFTKSADIVICAAGVPGLLKLENISKDTIVIDVGFTIIDGKIYGDAEFEAIHENGNFITPVPGGVGRLTVANLLKNTFKAYHQRETGLS